MMLLQLLYIELAPPVIQGQIDQFRIAVGITMDGKPVDDLSIAETFKHEGGHSGGLNHPWKLNGIEKALVPQIHQMGTPATSTMPAVPPASVSNVKANFMNSTENPDPK